MLTLVLAEAELEIMPSELCSHPSVIAHARQRGKQPQRILLDSNYHHAAMSRLAEGRRRGRPDITHLFLLTALESILNKKQQLNIYVHTRDNILISVSPQTRIMRNYERFLGLIEQLFEKHVVPDETHPLLSLQENIPLPLLLKQIDADVVLTFSKQGDNKDLLGYLSELKAQQKHHVACIIGGFPSGDFRFDLSKINTDVVSLYPEMLPAWTVASEVLVNYENVWR